MIKDLAMVMVSAVRKCKTIVRKRMYYISCEKDIVYIASPSSSLHSKSYKNTLLFYTVSIWNNNLSLTRTKLQPKSHHKKF